MATTSEEQWKNTIYLVGFPDVHGDATTIPIATHMRWLIPEARIFKHNIFGAGISENLERRGLTDEAIDTEIGCGQDDSHHEGNESKDSSDPKASFLIGLGDLSENSVAFSDLKRKIFLPKWIEDEATKLLNHIQQNVPREKRLFGHRIILAGYGFGGFVVKKAVTMANSTRESYELALAIDSLLFIDTPHRLTGQLTWEELLFKLLNAIDVSYGSRLLGIFPRLEGSVSRLSHDFYQFAAKHKITNIVGKDSGSESESMKFNTPFEEVISRSQTRDEMLRCAIHDVEYLELVKRLFTPGYVNQGTDVEKYPLQQNLRIDSYFELLQRLSPSRWLVYNNKAMECMEDFEILKEIYHPLLNEVPLETIIGHSVEIVSPKIHGGSTLLKLLSRKILESSSAVVVESNNKSQTGKSTRYRMYMSFIRQVISQRPSLFLPIQSMATEIMSQNIWTEEVLHTLLSSILINSDGVNFVLVIDDFETWPLELHSWLSIIQHHVQKASGSTFSVLTCSRSDITSLHTKTTQKIRLSSDKYTEFMAAFISAKVDHLLSQSCGSTSVRAELKARILQTAIPLVQSFEGSFATTSAYLMHLIHSIPFTSIKEITKTIQDIPATSEAIYRHYLQELLRRREAVRSWTTKVLSWLLLAVRPLHIKELAVAVALRAEHLTLDDLRNDISIDMEKDIRDHLGPLVKIEGQFASLASRDLSNILLFSGDTLGTELGILRDRHLVQLSLHYLGLTLKRAQPKDAFWENCLSQVSTKHIGLGYEEPTLEFLEYACRFWPTHLRREKNLDERLKHDVVHFLNQSEILNKWFMLYILRHGQIFNPFTDDMEPQEVKAQATGAQGTVVNDKYIYKPKSAIDMACYVGLSTIIPFLSPESGIDIRKAIAIRRGYGDPNNVVLNHKSRHYLDLIIGNDNTVDDFNVNLKELAGVFPLHRIAISGCLGAAEIFFKLHSNHTSLLSQTDSDGRTPFHMAAFCGSEEVLRFLIRRAVSENLSGTIEAGKVLDVKDQHCQTALMVAVRMGNVSAAKVLLESGAGVNIQDDIGRTALHFAASNCPQIIRCLMDQNNGAAFIADRDGYTPLHIAIKCASLSASLFLLEASRQLGSLPQTISVKDNTGKTALQHAAEKGFDKIALHLARAEEIEEADVGGIQKAAELAAMNGHLTTLRAIVSQEDIHNFGHQVLNAAACSNQLLVVYYLLQNDVSPNRELKDGHIILSNASSKGLTEVVRALLAYGADVNATDSKRRWPLHHAAKHGMCEIAEMLLAHKPSSGESAETQVHDLERYTPLHYAARAGAVTMVELLLRKNANIDARSSWRETPLHVAVGNLTTMQLLIDSGANLQDDLSHDEITPLHLAVIEDSLESVMLLLERGALWKFDGAGGSPLRYAIDKNNVIIVEAITQFQDRLEQCPEIPWEDLVRVIDSSALEILQVLVNRIPSIVRRWDPDGYTLLHRAAEFSEVGILDILLDAGSDIGALDSMRETPLFRAVISNNVDNLRLLIKRGRKIDECRGDGWMPLHIAAYFGHIEVAVALLEGGASIDQPAVCQATPLYLAQQRNMAEMVELLLKKGADPKMTTDRSASPIHICVRKIYSLYLINKMIGHKEREYVVWTNDD